MISHHHEFDKIISQCHPCDYLFIIYHNTRTNRNFVHTYHAHIHVYYTSTHCHFLTLQIAVTQQAMHNVLCDVLWQKKKIQKKIFCKKNSKKKIKKNISKKKNQKPNSKKNFKKKSYQTKFHNKKISTFFSPHKICIVSHSSYHTRRITLVVSHSHATSGGI